MAIPNYTRYFVTKTKCRTDGDVDYESNPAYSEKKAYAAYHNAIGAAYADTTYPIIGVALVDYRNVRLENEVVNTSWVDPNPTTETADTTSDTTETV